MLIDVEVNKASEKIPKHFDPGRAYIVQLTADTVPTNGGKFKMTFTLQSARPDSKQGTCDQTEKCRQGTLDHFFKQL